MRSALFIAAGLVCVTVSSYKSQAQPASQAALVGYDLHGDPVTHLREPGSKGAVLFFLATDCPISNRYVPEIQRLATEFEQRRMSVWLVYPNGTETAEGVVNHQKAYEIAGSTLVHPTASLMARIHPAVTPEAALLVPQDNDRHGFRVVYAGRIDDWYMGIGRQRPHATRHDLEQAVAAVASGQAVPPPGGPPVGCGIISEAALKSGAAKR